MRSVAPRALPWGLGLAGVVTLVGVFGPLLAPHDPLAVDIAYRLAPPSWAYPLGTDSLGRCLLSRTLAGARVSLALATATAGAVLLIAIALASVAVLGGRLLDRVVMRTTDVFLGFPALVFALALAAVMGPSPTAGALAIVWAWWPVETRVVRTLLHTARHRDFVDAARLNGVAPVSVLLRHIAPQVVPALAARFSLEVAGIMLALATLGFLGLGVQPPAPEWGVMLSDARPFVATAPHVLIGPGLAISASVLTFTLIAEGLRDRFDRRREVEW